MFSNASSDFTGRETDLRFLNDLYEKSKTEAQLLILAGKIRVGKTKLLKKFFQDKPHIYYHATKGSPQDQIQTTAELFIHEFGDVYLEKTALSTWKTFFQYLASRLKNQTNPLVIIFDEFQNLALSDGQIPSHFELGWDEDLKDKKILLILAGSSLSSMNTYALDHNSPLARKKTALWIMENFSYETAKSSSKSQDFTKTFSLYAIAGGVPAYLKEMDASKSIQENIRKRILAKSSFLSVEPQLLLADEFQESKIYLTILKAIGCEEIPNSHILNKTGLPSQKLSAYLSHLIKIKLVKRSVPVTVLHPEKSKKGMYSLCDNFLRFYFSFVYPHMSLIESGNFETLFKLHGSVLDTILEKSYEDLMIEILNNQIKKGTIPDFEQVGKYWDSHLAATVVATNIDANSVLFGKSYWHEKPLGVQYLTDLKKQSSLIEWGGEGRSEFFVLVCRRGFSQELHEIAKKDPRVVLIHEDKVLMDTV